MNSSRSSYRPILLALAITAVTLVAGCATRSHHDAPVVYHTPSWQVISRPANPVAEAPLPTVPATDRLPVPNPAVVTLSPLPRATSGPAQSPAPPVPGPEPATLPAAPLTTDTSGERIPPPPPPEPEPLVQNNLPQPKPSAAHTEVRTAPENMPNVARAEDTAGAPAQEPERASMAAPAPESTEPPTSATGASPQFQQGAAQSSPPNTITSLATLNATSDLRALAQRAVDVSDVIVRDVVTDRLIGIEVLNGELVYVRLPEPIRGLKPGEHVNVRGRILSVPEDVATLRMDSAAERFLQSQPIYIDATDLGRPAVSPRTD